MVSAVGFLRNEREGCVGDWIKHYNENKGKEKLGFAKGQVYLVSRKT